MSHDTGQLDISDRLMMANDAHSKPSEWTDIGQAEIIYTVFGKAKVRITRKHDKIRRLIFLLASVAVVFLLWEGWVLFQRYGTAQSNDSLFHINLNENEGHMVSSHDNISTSVSSGKIKSNEETLSGKAMNNANVIVTDKLEQPQNVLNSGKLATKQLVSPPLKTMKPQSAPLASNGIDQTNQAGKITAPFQSPKPLPQKNNAPLREEQGFPGSPATATPLDLPVGKEDVAPASAGENQLVDPTTPK
jgi:hypothetical protein